MITFFYYANYKIRHILNIFEKKNENPKYSIEKCLRILSFIASIYIPVVLFFNTSSVKTYTHTSVLLLT